MAACCGVAALAGPAAKESAAAAAPQRAPCAPPKTRVHVEHGLNGIELLQKPYAFDQLASAILRHLPGPAR